MELSETETVQTGLDNIRRKEHVALAIRETDHRRVDVCRRQLAMRLDQHKVGCDAPQSLGEWRKVLDPWHDDETLSAARTLAQQSGSDLRGWRRAGGVAMTEIC
jgi:hypothetical protein